MLQWPLEILEFPLDKALTCHQSSWTQPRSLICGLYLTAFKAIQDHRKWLGERLPDLQSFRQLLSDLLWKSLTNFALNCSPGMVAFRNEVRATQSHCFSSFPKQGNTWQSTSSNRSFTSLSQNPVLHIVGTQ